MHLLHHLKATQIPSTPSLPAAKNCKVSNNKSLQDVPTPEATPWQGQTKSRHSKAGKKMAALPAQLSPTFWEKRWPQAAPPQGGSSQHFGAPEYPHKANQQQRAAQEPHRGWTEEKWHWTVRQALAIWFQGNIQAHTVPGEDCTTFLPSSCI